MRVHIDRDRCQGHGRCYDLAANLFGEDDEGYGKVLADGEVSADDEQQARQAAWNCPESAIVVEEG